MDGIDIKCARIRAGLKQSELAELIFRHQSMVSDYELGKVKPNQQTLQAIAQITGQDLSGA
jgi:ribosome-binding protein aMBF1 (putative translation factor)